MERDLQFSLPPHPPPAQHPALGLGLGRRDMASSPRPYPAMGQRGLGRGRKSVPGPCHSPMMRRDRKIVMDPSRMLAAKSVNLEMILLLFETPSGFALFSISGTMFRDPDAMENLWANFAEDRKAEIVTILKGFQTFDDKSTAFDPFTGVHEKLKNMIMNCRRPGQPLAVGKLEYKAIIQVTLGIPCLYCEKVMEVMWGLQNCMRSLVPQEESELSKEDRLPMSHGLIKFLNLNGFDDVQPEMINDRIIMTASVLFDCDSMLKEYYVPLSLFGNLIKRVSRIDTRDWDSLKLATALKVVFCPEVGDYNEMFSEDERSKLVNDAHVYVRDISESLASETYEKLLKTCEVRYKKSILLRNLVMEAKERMKGEDR